MPIEECSTHGNEKSEMLYLFYSRECAESVYNLPEEQLDRFDGLIETSAVFNNMEIEKKYVYMEEKEEEVEKGIKESTRELGYQLDLINVIEQCDTYYDTEKFVLDNNRYTLRFRKIAEDNIITCKFPVSSASNGVKGQLERKEIEKQAESDTLEDNADILCEMMQELPDSQYLVKTLEKKIQVQNTRKKYILERHTDDLDEFPEKYELVLDHVVYTNLKNSKTYQECQMELELKSSYQNRINMKRLTDKMEEVMDFLESIEDSKYKRALQFTEK
ncbi:MAG: CYTH domain-containing protein [Ruminococcus flavefaciens]|nr:CYTH domain-containing protein [Ruminococcus flavefaciens]